MMTASLFRKTMFKSALAALTFILPVQASLHAEEQEQQVITTTAAAFELEPRYKLIDCGEIDINPANLSQNAIYGSLSPRINNSGQIIGNRQQGGFLIDPQFGEWAPYVHDVVIYFHSISNSGDILVSLNRQSNPVEWMAWPTTTGKNGLRQNIKNDLEKNGRPVFVDLTNERVAVGYLLGEDGLVNKSAPLLSGANKEPELLSYDAKPLTGQIKAINAKNQVVGIFQNQEEFQPAVWSASSGVQFIKNYRSKPTVNSEVELGNLLIADDGTVYGTYRILDKNSENSGNSYVYAWSPYGNGEFKLLDLEGMRLSSVNEWHVLVGSLDGQAVLCIPGKKPILLSKLINSTQIDDWELLEASAINDWGDIVGYGKFKGNTHLFFAKQMNSGAPYHKDEQISQINMAIDFLPAQE